MRMVAERNSLAQEINELQAKYSLLQFDVSEDGHASVHGILQFNADHNGKQASGEYEIKIDIPADYPNSVPVAFETGGQIAEDFHQYPSGALCLGAPLAVRQTFQKSRTLLCFVENLLIPYLFSHAYHEEHGEMPFGELEHGISGLVDFYEKLLHTNLPGILNLLRILADGRKRFRSYLSCPCNSGHLLGECHGRQIEELWTIMQPKEFAKELMDILRFLKKICPDIDSKQYLPYKTARKQRAKRRKQRPR